MISEQMVTLMCALKEQGSSVLYDVLKCGKSDNTLPPTQ